MVSVDVDMTVYQFPAASFQLPAPQSQLPVSSSGSWELETGNWKLTIHTLKDVPHPQLDFALGLLKMNPLLTRLVS